MAKYFCFGGRVAGVARSSPATVEDTTAGRFDGTFLDRAIKLTARGDYIDTAPFVDAASATTICAKFDLYYDGDGTILSSPLFSLFNSSGVEVVRIDALTTGTPGTMRVKYWDGAALQTLGSASAPTAPDALHRIQIKIVCGVGGSIGIWQGTTKIFTDPGTGLNAAVTNIARARVLHWGNGSSMWVSMGQGADYDVRDARFAAGTVNGNGNYTAGTGSSTDVDDTVLDDSDAIVLPASGNKKTFTKPSITLPGGYGIANAWVNARARVSGGVVTNGKVTFRSGSTDASTATVGPNGGYEPRAGYTATDPATSAVFTQSGYNSLEIGLEAV